MFEIEHLCEIGYESACFLYFNPQYLVKCGLDHTNHFLKGHKENLQMKINRCNIFGNLRIITQEEQTETRQMTLFPIYF